MGNNTKNSKFFDGNLSRNFINESKDHDFKLKGELFSPVGIAIQNTVIFLVDMNRITGISTIRGQKVSEWDTFLNDLILIDKKNNGYSNKFEKVFCY